MAEAKPNSKIDLDALVQTLNSACLTATRDLARRNAGLSGPVEYVIPEIQVDVQVSFSYEAGRLKALFSDSQSQQVSSRMAFKYVARPRQDGEPGA